LTTVYSMFQPTNYTFDNLDIILYIKMSTNVNLPKKSTDLQNTDRYGNNAIMLTPTRMKQFSRNQY